MWLMFLCDDILGLEVAMPNPRTNTLHPSIGGDLAHDATICLPAKTPPHQPSPTRLHHLVLRLVLAVAIVVGVAAATRAWNPEEALNTATGAGRTLVENLERNSNMFQGLAAVVAILVTISGATYGACSALFGRDAVLSWCRSSLHPTWRTLRLIGGALVLGAVGVVIGLGRSSQEAPGASAGVRATTSPVSLALTDPAPIPLEPHQFPPRAAISKPLPDSLPERFTDGFGIEFILLISQPIDQERSGQAPRGIYLAATEMSQAQYRKVVPNGRAPYFGPGGEGAEDLPPGSNAADWPIDCTWQEAQQWLSQMTTDPRSTERGLRYRAPDVTEFERAASSVAADIEPPGRFGARAFAPAPWKAPDSVRSGVPVDGKWFHLFGNMAEWVTWGNKDPAWTVGGSFLGAPATRTQLLRPEKFQPNDLKIMNGLRPACEAY